MIVSEISGYVREAFTALTRRKQTIHQYSKLIKVLNLFDVTFLSIGTTLGVGPYIFIGTYASTMGPGMVLAYIFAAVVAFLSASCYAELTCRGSGSGGAYTCTYNYIGEFPAAIVGWLLCLQSVIGSGLTVRGVSGIIDFLLDHKISNFIKKHIIKFNNPYLGEYPDFLSLAIVFIMITLLTFGLKEITKINNLFVACNLFLLILIILTTGSLLNWSLWTLPPKKGCGKGGFLPYGMKSIWEKTGLVFYAYLGFDAAAHAAAECQEPGRIIPVALIISIAIVMILYLLQSITHTLTWSYCDQDLEVPINYVLKKTGIKILSWISTAGVPLALLGSFLSSAYPLSRILYAMSEDGLFYSFMAELNIHTKVPVNALYTSGVLTGISAAILDKQQLAELTCLATLIAYSIVAVLVVYLRYTNIQPQESSKRNVFKLLFNLKPKTLTPTKSTSRVVGICCLLILLSSFPVLFMLNKDMYEALGGNIFKMSCIFVLISFYIFMMVVITAQPVTDDYLAFKMKLVPFLPVLSVLVNAYLSLTYSFYTWIRGATFLGIGFFIYITYGVWNSKLRRIGDQFYY